MMDIDLLRKENLIVFECVSGSHAYGLSLPHSDTDIKGVFILPKEVFYTLDYCRQVNNETNDIVFYELRKFIELLTKNNPTALEMLATPAASVIYKHPVFEKLMPEIFLSKLCRETFAGYAQEQIRKAKGLNKKIVNPVAPERKDILDFCYVPYNQGAVPVKDWLRQKGMVQEKCGLVKIPHMPGVYHLFYDTDGICKYKGIAQAEISNDISLSSVAADALPVTIMSFNKDGYSKYCADYKAYWAWVASRNEERYENTVSHGKNYDAKNMMHTFRLLSMAEDIAEHSVINVYRRNRDELLEIRSGNFEYDDLIMKAEEKLERINELFEKSALPESPDLHKINTLLAEMRESFYK